MMQHARARVHADLHHRLPTRNDYAPVLSPADQQLATTASRRTRRGDFLRAASWAITKARLHPRANATTLRVARDLAHRLTADGQVAYAREAMWRRLGISRRTLERHVAVLRELGLLVWAVHGCRTNTKPARSGEWAGTATIYAAVVPRVWDEALGHRVRGHGYHARLVGYTEQGRELAITEARRTLRGDHRRDAPSCKTNPQRRTAKAEREKKNIQRTQRRDRRPARLPESYRATADQAQHAMSVAAWIRPRVAWVQSEGLRRLGFALRPWIMSGLGRDDIAAELTSWWIRGRPTSPAALIMARQRTQQLTAETDASTTVPPPGAHAAPAPPNQAFLKAAAQNRASFGNRAAHTAPQQEPAFVIRDQILASLRQARQQWLARSAGQCATYAEWEALCTSLEARLR
ncbi:hypothetical protein ACWCOW_35785 [Streptomyces sp. NPDC001939]